MLKGLSILERLFTFAPDLNHMVLLFGISGGEIFLVLLFILVFFGADKIPGFARTMGKTIRQVKDATSEIQRDIQNTAKDVKDQVTNTMDQQQNDD